MHVMFNGRYQPVGALAYPNSVNVMTVSVYSEIYSCVLGIFKNRV